MPLWKALLVTHDKGGVVEEVNYLELLIAIVISCDITVNDKVHFTFTLFDLDKSEALTLDEVTILVSSVVNVMQRLGGVSRRVNIQEIESVVQQAMGGSDPDGSVKISYPHFAKWAKKLIHESKSFARLVLP